MPQKPDGWNKNTILMMLSNYMPTGLKCDFGLFSTIAIVISAIVESGYCVRIPNRMFTAGDTTTTGDTT